MRLPEIAPLAALLAVLIGFAGCGYHTVGAATHLPPDVKTLSVPVFATRTVMNGTETPMTEAVIREFETRTRLRVTAGKTDENFDAVLHRDDFEGGGLAVDLQHGHAAVLELPRLL